MKKFQFLPLLMLLFLAACEKEQPTPATTAEASALELREEKVTICHVKGNGDRIVLSVSASSVEAHLAHGDELGDCTNKPDICEEYAGGIVFYLVPEGEEMDLDGDGNPDQGLIAAPVGMEFRSAWGCTGTIVGASGTAIGTGWQNTVAIKQSGCAIATQLPEGEGWFIPSKDELNLMWENLVDGDGNDFNSGLEDPYNCGDFERNSYLSSTENEPNSALSQYFAIGNQSSIYKGFDINVRAVRAF